MMQFRAEESNLVPQFRRLRCDPVHPHGIFINRTWGRRLDSHQHYPPRLSGTGQDRRLSRSSHVGIKQECKESGHRRAALVAAQRIWRPLASQKHTPVVQGCPMGVEPIPSASQAGVPTTYTTDTILCGSTRNRTWPFSIETGSLEPRYDVRFTIEPNASHNA